MPSWQSMLSFSFELAAEQRWAMTKTHRHDGEGRVDNAGADGGVHRLLHARLLKDACGVIENLQDR